MQTPRRREIVHVLNPLVSLYLVFILELLHRAKLQQAHVGQLLQLLVKGEDVLPERGNRHILQSEWTLHIGSRTGGERRRERKSPFEKQLSFHPGGQFSDKMVLLHGVFQVFLQSVHLWSQVSGRLFMRWRLYVQFFRTSRYFQSPPSIKSIRFINTNYMIKKHQRVIITYKNWGSTLYGPGEQLIFLQVEKCIHSCPTRFLTISHRRPHCHL